MERSIQLRCSWVEYPGKLTQKPTASQEQLMCPGYLRMLRLKSSAILGEHQVQPMENRTLSCPMAKTLITASGIQKLNGTLSPTNM